MNYAPYRLRRGRRVSGFGLREIIGRRFDLDLVLEQVNRSLGDSAGIVVGVGADSERARDREPPRYTSCDRAMCDANADFPYDCLKRVNGKVPHQKTLADADD